MPGVRPPSPTETAANDPIGFYATFYRPGTQEVDMHNFLTNMAKHMLDVVIWEQGYGDKHLACCCFGKISTLPLHLMNSSLCSGSGSAELISKAMSTALSDALMKRFTHHIPLVAEVVKWKQMHLGANILHEHPDACVFNCCCALAKGAGVCVRGGNHTKCRLTSAMHSLVDKIGANYNDILKGLTSGFSCKNFSRAHVNYAMLREAMAKDMTETTSVKTFRATVAIIEELFEEGLLDFFVLENVDSIGDEHSELSNLTIVLDCLRSCCDGAFKVEIFRMFSPDYGLPQARLRVYMVGIRDGDDSVFADAHDSLMGIGNLVGKLKVPMFPLSSLLEPAGSEVLAAELARRQESHKDQPVQMDQKWVREHMAICEKKQLSWPLARPAALAVNAWFELASFREQEQIIFGAIVGDPWTDSSQSTSRTRPDRLSSNKPTSFVPTLLPGAHFWSHADGRFLIGQDMLSLQGIPGTACAGMAENHKADLAGNAFSSTCMLAIQLAIAGQVCGTKAAEMDIDDADQISALMKAFR